TPRVLCVITGGVVVHPQSLLGEIDGLVARGIKVAQNLVISDRAHVIFPWHIAEDRALDASLGGGESIGTTQRGIGPCYRDKAGRSFAIRLGDLYSENFGERVEHVVAAKNRSLAGLNGQATQPQLDPQQIFAEYRAYAERLKPFVADTTAL